MHIEPTCTAEMGQDLHYDELIADYNLHLDQSTPGMKAAYLLSQRSRDNYIALEKIGMLTIFRAMHEGRLIGIVSLLDVISVALPMLESLYVIKRFRHTGAGDALLEAAKSFCVARGSKAIIMGALPGGVIDLKLTRAKYPVISKFFYVEL
jgi:GNAT superfamily N-acetyltransferase